MVSSKQMLAELMDVLSREKFNEVKSSQVNEFLSILVGKAVLVAIRQPLKIVGEDLDDDMVLSTAWEERANFIVSGDRHLLSLKQFKGIKIVSVKEMIETLRLETG